MKWQLGLGRCREAQIQEIHPLPTWAPPHDVSAYGLGTDTETDSAVRGKLALKHLATADIELSWSRLAEVDT